MQGECRGTAGDCRESAGSLHGPWWASTPAAALWRAKKYRDRHRATPDCRERVFTAAPRRPTAVRRSPGRERVEAQQMTDSTRFSGTFSQQKTAAPPPCLGGAGAVDDSATCTNSALRCSTSGSASSQHVHNLNLLSLAHCHSQSGAGVNSGTERALKPGIQALLHGHDRHLPSLSSGTARRCYETPRADSRFPPVGGRPAGMSGGLLHGASSLTSRSPSSCRTDT